MTLLSVVTGSYNEEGNVDEWFERVYATVATLRDVELEIVWIDNASQDGTAAKVKAWCAKDRRVKLIVNARNFGVTRSPFHGIMQATGDAVIYLASDLQDSPELIPDFVAAWRGGAEVVAGVYRTAEDSWAMGLARRSFYAIMRAVSEAQTIKAFTGFGLYSRKVVELLRQTGGPMPYIRGLVAEFGLPWKAIAYDKPKRKYGASKNDLLALFDQAMVGVTTMSRAPIRFATLLGIAMSALGFLMAFLYLAAKLLFWDAFPLGQAPLLIGIFLFASVQIMIVGLIGEYVASIHLRLQNKPLVIELERINFDGDPAA